MGESSEETSATDGVRFGDGSKLGGDCQQERVEVVAAFVPAAVDEERRRTVDTAADAAEEVFADPRRVYPREQLAREARQVQADSRGVNLQILVLERVLVLVQ